MRRSCLLTLLCLLGALLNGRAAIIQGRVTNNKGEALPYASVLVKGTTRGTTTNAAGQYQLELPEGAYIIVCHYMGYRKEEKPLTLTAAGQQLDFSLQPLNLQIREVVVKGGGEDPAYAIIRQAIRKRPFYQQQVKEYSCTAYIKGMFKLRNVPDRVLGQKIDKADVGVDSTGKGILFLSESLTSIAFRQPDKLKLSVISARQSGGGFGFSFPAFIDFYDNNVTAVISQISPRGYISPIADNALLYYKYRLEGVFYEDGRAVNKIAVTPRRKFEPLFSGHILITDGDWRIHSTDLLLTRDYQLELMDTLQIRQLHVPVNGEVWRTKDQVVTLSFKQFGFDLLGNFVNIYSDYNLDPRFPPKYFDKTIMKYDTAFDKKNIAYWDSIRPVPLEKEEIKDFREKDSIAQARRDSAASSRHLDSLRRKQKRSNLGNILWTGGFRHHYYFRRDTAIVSHLLTVRPLIQQLEYNTVEGLVVSIEPELALSLPREQRLRIAPFFRYGFSNTHFNAYTEIYWQQDSRLRGRYGSNTWKLAGGKRISQFNPENPISPLGNAFYTLLLKENYMKLYESRFAGLQFSRRFESQAAVTAGVTWEDRLPVENTTDFTFFKRDKAFLPNHPYELSHIPFTRSQALIANIGFSFQPGQRYVELPDRRIAIGSKYPWFRVEYTKGIYGLGSDVDFDKWKVQVSDNMNFKLFGELHYRLAAGGFLNDNRVALPDFQHFNGNQTFYNIKYLNSFQLAPYYRYSTTAPFFATANLEHHFNGLLTNKIPLLNRWKWNLVAGSNAFYVNSGQHYVEVFAGLENIFKLLRVDVIAGYQSQASTSVGVRVGFGGLLGRAVFRR